MNVRQFDLFPPDSPAPDEALPLREEDASPFLLPEDAEPDVLMEGPVARRAAVPKAQLLERANALAGTIAAELGRRVRLSVTDNRSTMLSFRRAERMLVMRVHHMFLDAPPEVVGALARYAGRGERSSGAIIDAYVRTHQEAIRSGRDPRARVRLNPKGRVYDLQQIYDLLNVEQFQNGIDAEIGWGRSPGAGRRRTIRMGVYDHQGRTIRIHPALDRHEVPAFFVEYIVFHEMLHQAVPGKLQGSRKQHHSPEFRAREKAWHGYERAIAWEKQNLGLLLGKTSAVRVRPVD